MEYQFQKEGFSMELVVRTSIDNIKSNKYKNADAFLFGLKGLSIDRNLIALDELKLLDTSNIYILLDKNMFNSDLAYLEEVLICLDKLSLKGILFYDLAVLSISKRLGIKTPLIWNQNFFVTNYRTCNYYFNEGVSGALISSEITKDEIIEISKNTKLDLFVNIFGRQMMAFSKRYLVSNYFTFIGEVNDKDVNYMSERTGSYPVVEKDFGTKFFNKEVLCGIRYINEFKPFINHLILDDYMIDEDVFVKILSIFKEGLDASGDELIGLEREVNSLVSCDLGFFDKKTIYVVKRK